MLNRYAQIVNALASRAQGVWIRVVDAPGSRFVLKGARVVFAPLIAFGGAYGSMAKAYPFTTGFITTGFKTTAADAFAQKVIERKEEIDWQRSFLKLQA